MADRRIRAAASGATVLALAAATTPLHAPDRDPSATVLDRISITGNPDRIQEIPGSAQRLDREQLDRHSYTDPHRILRAVPGVNIREEEGFGLFPNIGMRGARIERNNRITTMEDGVLTAPAPYAAPAAYFFPPMGRMNSVEVRKGSSAIKYGPYTTGGALNMISTPIPNAEVAGKADVLFGSDGGQRTHAWAGGSSGQWGWLVEGYQDGSDGFKELDTPERSNPNMRDADTGYDRRSFMGKLRWNTAPENPTYQQIELKVGRTDMQANETYLGLTLDDFRDDPYRRYAGSQQDRINTERDQISLRHYIALGDELDLTTTAYYTTFVRNWYKLDTINGVGISSVLANPGDNAAEFDWARGQSGTGLTGLVKANNREYYARGIQSQLGYGFTTGPWEHDLEVGVRLHQDEIDRKQWEDEYSMDNRSMVFENGGRPGTESNRVTQADAIALYVQDTMTAGNWTVVPGLRYEDISIERENFQTNPPNRGVTESTSEADYQVLIPGIGATYQFTPAFSALAGVHRGFAPAGPGDDAEEEESINLEAGFRYNEGAFRSEVIGFFNQYDNLVAECTNASGGGCDIGDTFNGGEVDIYGVEALALYDLGAAMELGYQVPLSVSYTYTTSEFQVAGNYDYGPWGEVEVGDELPQIPEHQLTLSAGIINGPWTANATANYVSSARATAGSGSIPADDEIESRLLLDVAVDYAVNDNISLYGSVENLTDEEYVAAFRPAGARPGKPRTYWSGLKMRF